MNIELVRDPAGIMQMRKRVKTGAGFTTNLFLSDALMGEHAASGRLYGIAADGINYFVLDSGDFHRLYFAASALECLQMTLSELPLAGVEDCVTDLIGAPDAVDKMVCTFLAAGFTVYTQFQRMTRVPRSTEPVSGGDEGVRYAAADEAPTVYGMIKAHFDARAEHIPSADEISAAIDRHAVLIADCRGEPAAMLFYDRTGVSTVLRYWLVMPPFRRQGYGDKVLRRYFADCAGCRRFMLWVQCSNNQALRHYTHYGYGPDGAIDRILRRQTAA